MGPKGNSKSSRRDEGIKPMTKVKSPLCLSRSVEPLPMRVWGNCSKNVRSQILRSPSTRTGPSMSGRRRSSVSSIESVRYPPSLSALTISSQLLPRSRSRKSPANVENRAPASRKMRTTTKSCSCGSGSPVAPLTIMLVYGRAIVAICSTSTRLPAGTMKAFGTF